MTDEQWRPIPDFEGYEVSNHGRVRSYWKQARGRPRYDQWIIAKEPQRFLSTNGKASKDGRYPVVYLKSQTRYVHRLIMSAFVGPCPEGLIVCHNDDNPDHNHLSNLRYDTPQSNVHDAIASGNWQPGEAVKKLTPNDVITIRNMALNRITYRAIARRYPIQPTAVYAICSGHTYGDVGGPITQEKQTKYKPRKLTDEQIALIRHKLRSGCVQADLAREYDVSNSFISRIKSGARR